MNDLQKLIELAKIVAKPWVIATSVLSFLLCLSVAGNIYMINKKANVIIENEADFISSDNNVNAIIKE